MDSAGGLPPIEVSEFFQGRLDRVRDQQEVLALSTAEDAPALQVEVEILGARGLTEAAWAGFGRSQRFCTCQIPGKPHSEVQTPALDDTQAPEWHHKMEIQDFELGDNLRFQVIAIHPKYRKWKAVLGTASLESNDFEFRKGFCDELPLASVGARRTQGYLKVRVCIPRQEEKKEEVATPKAKQRQVRPGQTAPRPVAVPSILEECIKVSKAGAERRRQGEDQDPSSPSAEPKEGPQRCVEDLPPGWEAAWDTTHERYYFYNHDLGVSSWEWPEDEQPKTKRPGQRRSLPGL